jgi:hypothetical protein
MPPRYEKFRPPSVQVPLNHRLMRRRLRRLLRQRIARREGGLLHALCEAHITRVYTPRKVTMRRNAVQWLEAHPLPGGLPTLYVWDMITLGIALPVDGPPVPPRVPPGVHQSAHVCVKCNHNQVEYTQMQTRSADEGMTTFLHCTACDHRWRD